MPRYINKMNLPQYRYYNDLIKNQKESHDFISEYVAACHQLQYGDTKGYRDGVIMLSKCKSELADFLYLEAEDRKRCKQSLVTKNFRSLQNKMDNYVDVMQILPFFQGSPMMKRVVASETIAATLSKPNFNKNYEYDPSDGKYYYDITCIPKLVLVNQEIYNQYLLREMTENVITDLIKRVVVDVNYIVSVQSEDLKDSVFMIGEDKGKPVIRVLNRKTGLHMKTIQSLLSEQSELGAVSMSLLDYLLEMEKGQKVSQYKHAQSNSMRERNPKYIDGNSIKIFDVDSDGKTQERELPIYFFKKKNASLGNQRKKGMK